MNSEYERIYNNLKDSYTSLYKRISKDCRTMMDTSLIYSLKLSAKRTNENIGESLEESDSNKVDSDHCEAIEIIQ